MQTKVYTYPQQTIVVLTEKPEQLNPTDFVLIDKNNNGVLDKEDIAIGVGGEISQTSQDCSTFERMLSEERFEPTNYCVKKINERVLKDLKEMGLVNGLLKAAKAGREAVSKAPPTSEGFCSDRASRYSLWGIKFEPPISLSTRKTGDKQLISLSVNPFEHPEKMDPARCWAGYGVVKIKINGSEVSANLYINDYDGDPLNDLNDTLSRRFGISNDEGKMDADYRFGEVDFVHVDLPRP